jgi:ribonuclease HII
MDNIVEQDLRSIGLNKVAGVDEVGRGCGAGPVVTACVMLPAEHKIEGLKDSKKLSAKKRDKLATLIYERALAIELSSMSNIDIDKYNIYQATKISMSRCINKLSIRPDMVVVDGNFEFFGDAELKYPYMSLVQGDSLSENVAAASILAKTYRDNWMIYIEDKRWPEYGFDGHKGYLTKKHIDALKEYGPCAIHRMTFTVKGVKISDMGKKE